MHERPLAASMLATLIIDAVLLVIALGLLSIVVTPSSGPGNRDLNAAWTSVLAITPENGQSDGGGLAGSRTFTITMADLDAITRSIADTIVLSRVVSGTAAIGTGNQAPRMRVEGVDPSYGLLPEGSVASGMFFSSQDANAANRVAILGQAVAANLFPNGQSSIGQTIRIRNQPFTVMGVLASQAGAAAESSGDAILIPFQTSQIRLFGATAIDEVLLGVRDASQTDGASLQIKELLRQRHRVPSGQPDGFTILTDPSTSASRAVGTLAQLIDRVHQLSRSFACDAKALCGPAHAP